MVAPKAPTYLDPVKNANLVRQASTPIKICQQIANCVAKENFQTRLEKQRAHFATQENGQTSWVLLIAPNVVKAGTLWKLVLPQTYVKSAAPASTRMKKEQAHAKIVNPANSTVTKASPTPTTTIATLAKEP